MDRSQLLSGVLYSLVLLTAVPATFSAVKIASFNIQIFGQKKMESPQVVQTLIKIIQIYDIVAIQEIRDSEETAIIELVKQVNETGPYQYLMAISGRLGQTTSKEQYAFLYRANAGIRVEATYQYPDPQDIFSREPFAVYFVMPEAGIEDLALINVHTDPQRAPEEIDGLVDVIASVQSVWFQPNVMVLGDFNADCSYFNAWHKEHSKLRTCDYVWLVPDYFDTTVSHTECAYDRFVVPKDFPIDKLVENSVKLFNFKKKFGLSQEEARDVSDHFPVEFEITSNTCRCEERRGVSDSSGIGDSANANTIWAALVTYVASYH